MTRRTVVSAAVATLSLVALRTVLLLGGFHKNLTDSVPIGLYRETTNGAYLSFCLPPPVLAQATAAGLDLDPGPCPGGVVPVMKNFHQATPESPVTLSAQGVAVGGHLLANTAPKPYSHTGKLLSHYPFGSYSSGLWAVSSFNPNSYDSRYFGPVEPSTILYHLQPFWTF